MRTRIGLGWVAVAVVVALAGCNGDADGGGAPGGGDASDALAGDAPTVPDVAPDTVAAPDTPAVPDTVAAPDGAIDAAPDAAPGTDVDAAPGADADTAAAPDAGTDAASDTATAPDAAPDAAPAADTVTATDAVATTDADAAADTAPAPDTVTAGDAATSTDGDAVADVALPTDAATSTDGDAVADVALPTDAVTSTDGDAAADVALPTDGVTTTDADASPETVDPWPGYEWEPEASCGMAPYEWLPPADVAGTILWAENLVYRLPPEVIEAMAADLGYGGIIDVRYGTRVYALRYTTQDRGETVEATALVGIPDLEPDESLALPTMVMMHPTMGFADRCAPSASLEGAALALIPATQGYIAVAPDGLGMCGVGGGCPDQFHPYLLGEPTAIAALDAVRAAHEQLLAIAEETGVVPDSRIVPIGPSQGGHASLFVHRYAPIYAPEYEVPCVASSVPPADLRGQALNALASLRSATDMGLAFLAAAYLWYEPDVPLSSLLNADGPRDYPTHVIDTFYDTCRSRDLVSGASSLEDLFTAAFLTAFGEGGWDAVEPWGCMARENSLPWTSVPYLGDAEVLIVLGENDRIVDATVEHGSIAALCDQGYRIEHLECAGVSHSDAVVDSVTLQLQWVEACLDGATIPDEDVCVITAPVSCDW